MKTLEDWKDAYYEQQALHTEARGMLCQERDAARAKLADWEALFEELTGMGGMKHEDAIEVLRDNRDGWMEKAKSLERELAEMRQRFETERGMRDREVAYAELLREAADTFCRVSTTILQPHEERALDALKAALAAKPEGGSYAEARFPRYKPDPHAHDGWIIDPGFLKRVREQRNPIEADDYMPDMEGVEAVLLALEKVRPSQLTCKNCGRPEAHHNGDKRRCYHSYPDGELCDDSCFTPARVEGEGRIRTPKDYAIEHANYFLAAFKVYDDAHEAAAVATDDYEAENIGFDAYEAAYSREAEAMGSLRDLAYEFEKRRDRAEMRPVEYKSHDEAGPGAPWPL